MKKMVAKVVKGIYTSNMLRNRSTKIKGCREIKMYSQSKPIITKQQQYCLSTVEGDNARAYGASV